MLSVVEHGQPPAGFERYSHHTVPGGGRWGTACFQGIAPHFKSRQPYCQAIQIYYLAHSVT